MDARLLEVERNYLATKAREKVYLTVIFFLLGGMSAITTTYLGIHRTITLLSERQAGIAKRLERMEDRQEIIGTNLLALMAEHERRTDNSVGKRK